MHDIEFIFGKSINFRIIVVFIIPNEVILYFEMPVCPSATFMGKSEFLFKTDIFL